MNSTVALVLWVLLLLYTFRVRRRPDNSMYAAIGLIAIAMTTNIDTIYLAVGPLIPIPNLLALVGNLCMLAGVYYLARSIQKGAGAVGTDSRSGGPWTRRGAWAAAALMCLGFWATDAQELSTTFMLDYGDQLPAAIYSLAQFIYLGLVLLATYQICQRNVPYMRQKRFRVGFRLITVGCMAGILLCICVVLMDVLHLMDQTSLMRTVGAVYNILRLVAAVVLAAGLSIPPIARQLESRRRRSQLRDIAPAVQQLWQQTVAEEAEFSLAETDHQSVDLRTASPSQLSDVVHRMVVEINDWASLASTRERLTPEDQQMLDNAEKLCLHQSEVTR